MEQLVYDRCEKSMVRLHSNGVFRGSGFVIHTEHDECLIMTCFHVLLGRPKGEILYAYLSGENEPFQCEVLYWDDKADLALLQSVPRARMFDSLTPLEFCQDKEVALQMDIVLLSFYTLEDGVNPMIRPGTSPGRIIDQPRTGKIVYSSSCKPGTSGGAVICSWDGAEVYVVGVHGQTDLTTSYAAHVEAIGSFLCAWVNSVLKEEDEIDVLDIKTMLQMGPRLQHYVTDDEDDDEDDDDEV